MTPKARQSRGACRVGYLRRPPFTAPHPNMSLIQVLTVIREWLEAIIRTRRSIGSSVGGDSAPVAASAAGTPEDGQVASMSAAERSLASIVALERRLQTQIRAGDTVASHGVDEDTAVATLERVKACRASLEDKRFVACIQQAVLTCREDIAAIRVPAPASVQAAFRTLDDLNHAVQQVLDSLGHADRVRPFLAPRLPRFAAPSAVRIPAIVGLRLGDKPFGASLAPSLPIAVPCVRRPCTPTLPRPPTVAPPPRTLSRPL